MVAYLLTIRGAENFNQKKIFFWTLKKIKWLLLLKNIIICKI